MNDAYQKMSEMLDNWLSDNTQEMKMAFIEKDILLEKLRKLYVQIASVETEEYDATVSNKPELQPEAASKKEFTPAKTLEEDVDLFFDTEHESYKHVEQELKEIANEIEEAQKQPLTTEPEPVVEEVAEDHSDIFDTLEDEKPEEETSEIHDNAEELFEEPDFEIRVPEEESHEEDDILQFIPPKKAPVASPEKKEETVQPQPEAPQPVRQEVPAEPVEMEEKKPEPVVSQPVNNPTPTEAPLQKPQQRSLNDLFNEQREDHSISSQYQRAKVGDLTKAISINDKFIYIKELFHNRGEDFSAAIHQLNECQNMEEAFNCLDTLKSKYFWDSKSDAYLSFCDLLRRKFS